MLWPVTNSKKIKRICELLGTTLTPRFKSIVDKFGNNPFALKQEGTAYAKKQIIYLILNGIKGIHLYTMNKTEVSQKIIDNISGIFNN